MTGPCAECNSLEACKTEGCIVHWRSPPVNAAPSEHDIALMKERDHLRTQVKQATDALDEIYDLGMNGATAVRLGNIADAALRAVSSPARSSAGTVELRSFVERYADHDEGCEAETWHGKGPMRCSCGFYEAMERLEALARPSADSTEDMIGEAWRVLEEHGFPPEACEYLPAAIDNALTAMTGARDDLLAEVMRLRAQPQKPQEPSVEAERQRCIAICEGWIGRFQDREIQYTSAREYAVDAIEDIIDLIRDGSALSRPDRGGA